MNQDHFNEDPFAMGSQAKQVITQLKSENEWLRATLKSITTKTLVIDPTNENLWEEVLKNYGDEKVIQEYYDWKEENDDYKFEDLKAKQTQEIYKFLKSRFFRFYKNPTGAEVKHRKLVITEDDLEVGSTIPHYLAAECSKFERFFELRGEHILILNYDKLENYIRKHFHKFKPQDLQIIAKFDQCMDLIHDDMAKLKTSLSLHLKRYEENLVMQKKSDCLAIFNTCKQFINSNVRANLLHDYVDMLLFDEEMREEARGKLKGQSMKKYICEMVAVLRWFDIFRNDVTAHMIASAISKKMVGVESKTLQTYIEKFYNAREGRLYEWTKANIEQLKKAPYNPFALII